MDGSSVNGPIINAFKYIVTRIEPLANLLESNKSLANVLVFGIIAGGGNKGSIAILKAFLN